MLLPIIVPILSAALGLVPPGGRPFDPGQVNPGNPLRTFQGQVNPGNPLRTFQGQLDLGNPLRTFQGQLDPGNPLRTALGQPDPRNPLRTAPGQPDPGNPLQTGPDQSNPRNPVDPGRDTDQPGVPNDQRSGICGTVYSIGGNRMPAPNRRRIDSGAIKHPQGVKATVYIYSLTSDSQVVHADPTHYRTILTPLISRIETDEKGKFQVFLPPGTYSVFTKKGELFYASRRDEKNHIAPVEVLPGKITQVSCSVESDHKAVY